MKTSVRHGVDTRWLYNLEATAFRQNKFGVKNRPLKFLHALMLRIWAEESRAGTSLPVLKFGRGIRHGEQMVSYCLGTDYIELAPGQRDVMTMIHEVTHALGITYHGKRFIKRYFPMLIKYGKFDRVLLEALAMTRGVTL